MHILHTVLHTFPMELIRRTCLTIKTFFTCWPFPFPPPLLYMIEPWTLLQVYKEKIKFWSLLAVKGFNCFNYLNLQIFYLPLALAVPPSIFCVHAQFNMLYQFWIHTEIVRTLGPLEYILNTPSHHRVHHGNYSLGIVHEHAKSC